MSNLSVFHLIGAITYLAFGLFVLMRNRHARHYQLFSLLMVLFFWESVSFLITNSATSQTPVSRLFFTQSLIAELLIAPVFTWFVMVLSQKYRILRNGFFFLVLFGVPVALTGYHLISEEATTMVFSETMGGHLMWSGLIMKLIVFVYIFLNGLVSFMIILRFGLKSIDYRVRVLSKTVSVAVLVVFSYSLLDQLQYILYNEKIAPDIYNLVALVGFSFVLAGLIRQKNIIFSSSVLSENILEHLTAPVLLMDERGRIIYYNRVLQEITAFRPSELNGMHIMKLLPDLKMTISELINYGRYGMHHIRTTVEDAFENNTKVILSLRAIYDHSGDFEGVVCTLEGVNKPMQGQYDSRNQDERLLNAFAASDKGFWDWDIKQGELFFSETACYILGYEPAELANLSFSKWREMLHYEFRDDYFDTLNRHLKQQSDTFYMEYKVKTKNGEWIWILDKGRITAFDSENNPERMSGVFTDITRVKAVEDQLRKYKKKLEETIKFKNRLIDLLSTDIREPFNAIIGLSEIASIGAELDEEEQGTLLKEISEQAGNAYQLIDEILHLANIDEGRIKKEMESFRLKDFLLDIRKSFQEPLTDKKLQLILGEDNPTIKTDRQIIRRILSILTENAIKFSHEGQEVNISWERDNGDLYLTVRDYGVGLTLREQKKLFKIDESFVNLGTRGETGHGLGLLIADRLAKIVDAKISFRSSKDEGSEFVLKIPGT